MKIQTGVVMVAGMLSIASGASYAATQGFDLGQPPNVAMIILASIHDGGWSEAFNEARLKMEKSLNLKIPYVEKVPEDAAAIMPPAEKLIQRGANILIGTAYGYSDSFRALSNKYPKLAFLNAGGTTNGPNLQSFYGRTYESQYLCGMAAAAVSKSGKLGFVAALPIGAVNWTINAYELGAQKINPKATVTVIYTGTWNDPVKERAAAEALVDEGIDAIGQHVDTPTPQIVAQEHHVYGTGLHRDMRQFAPQATVCSSVWIWDRFLGSEVKKITSGNWVPSPYGEFPGIKEGGTEIACCGEAVPKDAVDKIMAERQAIIDGKQVFQGPLADREGKQRVPDGQVLSVADLWKMDWFVPGVITQK